MPGPDRNASDVSAAGHPSRSLVASALWPMAVRIGLVVIAASTLTHWHFTRILRQGAESTLTHYVQERAQREGLWFDFIVRRQIQMRDGYATQYRALASNRDGLAAGAAEFDKWFVVRSDGRATIRPLYFTGTTDGNGAGQRIHGMSGIIDRGVRLTDEVKLRHALAANTIWSNGPSLVSESTTPSHTPFLALYFLTPEQGDVQYFPEIMWDPYAKNEDFRYDGHSYYDLGLPAHNPERRTRWTSAYVEETSGIRLVTSVTPVDVDGRYLGHFATDIEIDTLDARIRRSGIAGATDFIIGHDGSLIAHGGLTAAQRPKRTSPDVAPIDEASLQNLYRLARLAPTGAVMDDQAGDRLLATAPIGTTGWKLVTVYPKPLLAAPAREIALIVLLIGIASLGIELLALRRVLKDRVSAPIHSFIAATSHIAAGERSIDAARELPVARRDEIGVLARSFARMVERLREAADQLEHRVVERTSELRQANQALDEARHEAVLANESKSRFLANMSHEVRTPLNGVLGLTELLQQSPLSDEQRRWLAMLKDSGESLLRLLNDMLDVSKIESGHMSLLSAPFSLRGLVDSSTQLMAAYAQRKGLSLHCEIEPGIADDLLGDEFRVRQILLNLLSNAIKFTAQGEVRLVVALDAPEPERGIALRFSVYDTGIGLPPERIERLFEAFVQADSGIGRTYGGTGLGLTICSHLAGMMDGRIWAENRPQGGSAFHVSCRFDRAARPATDRTIDSEPLRPAGRARRILIVEDNGVNRVIAKGILAARGHTVEEAADGREGLDAMLAHAFDVVLMDIRMPVMDGLEATRRIRSIERANQEPRRRIVALTASAMNGDREACLAAGIDDFICKPFTSEELLAAVEETELARQA